MEIEVDNDVTMSEPELLSGLLWVLSKSHLDDNTTEHPPSVRLEDFGNNHTC